MKFDKVGLTLKGRKFLLSNTNPRRAGSNYDNLNNRYVSGNTVITKGSKGGSKGFIIFRYKLHQQIRVIELVVV